MSNRARGVPPQDRAAVNAGIDPKWYSPYEVGPFEDISTSNTEQDIRAGLRKPADADIPAKYSSDQEMSKPVLFYGKPGQLDDCITYCDVKCLVDGIAEDRSRCGLLASLFRGQALHWLTSQIKTVPKTLTDYEEFKETVRNAFGLSEEATRAKAARRLGTISQKGPCQLYAIEFRQLKDTLRLDEQTSKAAFIRGLKQHVREAIVTTGPHDTLTDLIEESVRIDTELYNARRQAGSSGKGKRARGTLKCHACGKFGHKATECRTVKQEQY
jgi:hypothetical protein